MEVKRKDVTRKDNVAQSREPTTAMRIASIQALPDSNEEESPLQSAKLNALMEIAWAEKTDFGVKTERVRMPNTAEPADDLPGTATALINKAIRDRANYSLKEPEECHFRDSIDMSNAKTDDAWEATLTEDAKNAEHLADLSTVVQDLKNVNGEPAQMLNGIASALMGAIADLRKDLEAIKAQVAAQVSANTKTQTQVQQAQKAPCPEKRKVRKPKKKTVTINITVD